MTATHAAPFRITTDTWELARLREAKEYRDANPSTTDADRATDAWLDAWLEACEAAVAEVGTVTERPVADEATPARRSSTGGTVGGSSSRNAATDAQLRFLASLARDLGRELDTPRDRSHASLLIDAAKKELTKLRAAGTAPAGRPERLATPGQVAYLADLLATRVHTYGEVDPAAMTFTLASAVIDALASAPRVKVGAHGIAEGRYAFQPADGAATFYRIGRTGRITVQAGPSEHPYNGKLNEALLWIADNQRDAAALYGRLLGVCGMCGRELTDETSRALGLGPICAAK